MSRKPGQDQTDPDEHLGPGTDAPGDSIAFPYSINESVICGGYKASGVHSYVSIARTKLFKTGLAVLATAVSFLLLQSCSLRSFQGGVMWTERSVQSHLQHARNVARSFLEVFQVFQPLLIVSEGKLKITDGSSNTTKLINNDRARSQQLLVAHSFASSYNSPFVGKYAPPSCSFNRVTWNLTVISAGKQFDRLGIVYLGDVEVFRTSTAEPTRDGIKWSYLKDMTNFLPLFENEQKLIFDLGNLINDIYTAAFNVTLTASYFTANDSIVPADAIFPVSKRLGSENQPSAFMVPPENALNHIQLPRNLKKAVFTVAATGQNEEEFWWSNVLQSDIDSFPQYGKLYGHSPFREIQLRIDGMLAGVAWPFPIIFTGGIVPGLWRPIVGIDAFDLKEYEIDITPWLPLLCDGHSHEFSIRVAGLADGDNGTAVLTESIGSYWWVTGKIFVWSDTSHYTTTGSGPHVVTSASEFGASSSIKDIANGTNETLQYHVHASRSLDLYSTINVDSGKRVATWSQRLSFANVGLFRDGANLQENNQSTRGHDASSSGYAKIYSYPLYVNLAENAIRDNYTIVATVNGSKLVKTIGSPIFPTGLERFSACETVQRDCQQLRAAELLLTQIGRGTYLANETDSTSFTFGTMEQHISFEGLEVDAMDPLLESRSITGTKERFERFVKAVNQTVVDDRATLSIKPISHVGGFLQSSDSEDFGLLHGPECGDLQVSGYEIQA